MKLEQLEADHIAAMKDRFWKHVQKNTLNGECWLWVGAKAKSNNGHVYGVYAAGPGKRKRMLAHRLSWIFSCGSLEDDTHVFHLCENSLCVRPDHLSLSPKTISQHTREEIFKTLLER